MGISPQAGWTHTFLTDSQLSWPDKSE